MALNKKEQAEMAALKREALLGRALRWTDPVPRDLPPPNSGVTVTQGWDFNAHCGTVDKAWSSAVHHGRGEYQSKGRSSGSQNPRTLFSNEELALRACRHAMERDFAERLAAIDARLEALRGAA
jgi:hypothetical protein